jgi:GNAT superfamily N-acetyltransferase
MKIVFRACTESFLPIVQRFVLTLYSESMVVSKNNIIQRTFEEFETHPEKGRILVFETDAGLVGYAILVFFWSNEFGSDVIEIDELFVQEEYRGRGISTAFLVGLRKNMRANPPSSDFKPPLRMSVPPLYINA